MGVLLAGIALGLLPVAAHAGAHGDLVHVVVGRVVRAEPAESATHLRLATPTGRVDVVVAGDAPAWPAGTLIRAVGKWRSETDNDGSISLRFHVSSGHLVDVVRVAQPLESLQVTPIATAARDALEALPNAARIRGVVTLVRSVGVYIADHSGAIYVTTRQTPQVALSDLVEAVGFPEIRDGRPRFSNAAVEVVGRGVAVEPAIVDMAAPMSPDLHAHLVQFTATVRGVRTEEDGSRLKVSAGDVDFDVWPPSAASSTPALIHRPGDTVRITGIAAVLVDSRGTTREYRVYPRTAGDIAVVSAASWFTASRLGVIALAIGGLLITVSGWGAMLWRRLPRAERALRETERRYRDIFEHGGVGNLVTRGDGTIVAGNATFFRMLGLASAQDVISANIGRFFQHSCPYALLLSL